MTSRPLYMPQCGQARCGGFGSWQFGHSDMPGARRWSWARRVEVRRFECLRFGFGMKQIPSFEYSLGTPPVAGC